MKEVPASFGQEQNLVGVATLADSAGGDIGCLLFNAGIIHRIGAHRINVKLARALAGLGVSTLRFDLSGVGDSRATSAGRNFRDQAVHDVRAAMDHMEEQYGIRRFVVFGICSGAVNAFWAALADPRIAGVMMFDGFWYRTLWTRPLGRLRWLRVLSITEIVDKFVARLRVGFRRDQNAVGRGGIFSPNRSNPNPPKKEFVEMLRTLVDRKVSLYFLYGGTVINYYSYARQFADVFGDQPFFSRLRCDFRPDIDHNVVGIGTQRTMIGLVADWVRDVQAGTQSRP